MLEGSGAVGDRSTLTGLRRLMPIELDWRQLLLFADMSRVTASGFNIWALSRWILLFTAAGLVLVFAACSGQRSGSSDSSDPTSTDAPTSTATPTTASPDSSTSTSIALSTTTTMSLELGPELVFNSDFTTGGLTPTGWEITAEGPGQEVDYVTGGEEEHLRFFGPLIEEAPWPEAKLAQTFDVEPHTDYRLAVEARTASEGRLFMAMVFLDEEGDEILLRGPGSPEVSEPEWRPLEGVLESPVDAASAYVVMRLAIRPDLAQADSFSVEVNSVSVKEVLG